MNMPYRLAAVNGAVLILDYNNDRVIMLNATTFEFIKQVTTRPSSTELVTRMSVGHDGERLYIAYGNFQSSKCVDQGLVKEYHLTWNWQWNRVGYALIEDKPIFTLHSPIVRQSEYVWQVSIRHRILSFLTKEINSSIANRPTWDQKCGETHKISR